MAARVEGKIWCGWYRLFFFSLFNGCFDIEFERKSFGFASKNTIGSWERTSYDDSHTYRIESNRMYGRAKSDTNRRMERILETLSHHWAINELVAYVCFVCVCWGFESP